MSKSIFQQNYGILLHWTSIDFHVSSSSSISQRCVLNLAVECTDVVPLPRNQFSRSMKHIITRRVYYKSTSTSIVSGAFHICASYRFYSVASHIRQTVIIMGCVVISLQSIVFCNNTQFITMIDSVLGTFDWSSKYIIHTT